MAAGSDQFDPGPLNEIGHDLGPERVRELIELFLDHSPERLRQVRDGQRSGDLEASAGALHSIRSSAAMIGANELTDVAGAMEKLAKDDDAETLAAMLVDLERAFDTVTDILTEHVGGLDA